MLQIVVAASSALDCLQQHVEVLHLVLHLLVVLEEAPDAVGSWSKLVKDLSLGVN